MDSAARDFDDPTKRVEATTTPEGAKGWADRGRLGTDSPAGGHGLNVAPDASPEGVRAETRRREDRAGGEPSNAPTAGNAASAFVAKEFPWAIHLGDKIVSVYETQEDAADAMAWYIDTYGETSEQLTIGLVRDV